MSYGTFGHVGICFQQSFGTVYTNSYDYAPILNESLTEEIPALISQSIQGRFEEGDTFEGFHTIGGDVQMETHPEVLGKLLKAWTNTHSVHSSPSSVWQHTFLPAQTDWDSKAATPPMTMEIYRAVGSSFLYYDCCANTLTFEYAHGELMKTTMGVVGANFERLAATTPSYDTTSAFPWHVTSVSIGGAAVDNITNLSITLTNNIEGKGTLDTTKRANRILRTGFRTCEISGTFIFDDQTQFNQFVSFNSQRLQVTALGAAYGNGNIQFDIDIPKMIYTAFPVNISGGTTIEVGFSGRATYDNTSSYLIELNLYNATSGY